MKIAIVMEHEPSTASVPNRLSGMPILRGRTAVAVLIGGLLGAGVNELRHYVRDQGVRAEVSARERSTTLQKDLAMSILDARRVMSDINEGKLNHIVPILRIRILAEWVESLEEDRGKHSDLLSSNEVLRGQLERILHELRQSLEVLLKRHVPQQNTPGGPVL